MVLKGTDNVEEGYGHLENMKGQLGLMMNLLSNYNSNAVI
jgi:hypothetical protein